MNEQDRSRSPFSELSFSQQQEMWRIWRAQPLKYQEMKVAEPEPKVVTPPSPPPYYAPPSHKNLDQVHARIAAAAARAGDFHPLT